MELLTRRQFLGRGVAAAAALGAASLGCSPKRESASDSEPGQVSCRRDPKSGQEVSVLGYGCMRWPMTKDAQGKDIVDQETVNEMVDYAISHGVNYFDTAPIYLQGLSEHATALALSRYPRESYFLATKLSNFNPNSYTLEFASAMLSDSLKNLMTDYIDYYLLHSVNSDFENFRTRFVDNGILEYLLEQRKKGVLRHLGFSFHSNCDVLRQLMDFHEEYKTRTGEPLFDFVMMQLNWYDWHHSGNSNADAADLYAILEAHGLPVMVMEPLLGGRLSDVPDHIAEQMKEKEPGRSLASWAFRFAASHKNVLCVLSGMSRMEHLRDNLRTFSPLVELDEQHKDFLERMAGLMSSYPLIPCNDCKYCMPCPYGLDIPAIFTHYNKCVNEGYVSASAQDPEYRKNRRAYLVSYDRAVPRQSQADRCISCARCVTDSHCPQHIAIPREMMRISKYIEELRRSNSM